MNPINIVYLHSHDTGRYVQPYGCSVPTYSLQNFAEQGVLFCNAHCTAPHHLFLWSRMTLDASCIWDVKVPLPIRRRFILCCKKARRKPNHPCTKNWKSDWHLVAVNWTTDYLELSIDGGSWRRSSLPEDAASTTNLSRLLIGSSSGTDEPYLIDELFIFNLTLSNDEVKWISQSDEKKIGE